jgi:hypothetical protein
MGYSCRRRGRKGSYPPFPRTDSFDFAAGEPVEPQGKLQTHSLLQSSELENAIAHGEIRQINCEPYPLILRTPGE